MLTIMVQATVKEECLEEFLATAALLTSETRGKRRGCTNYSFNQREDSPTEFVLFEQWQSEADLNNHIAALIDLLGPPPPGGLLPERLIRMYKTATPYYYRVIE